MHPSHHDTAAFHFFKQFFIYTLICLKYHSQRARLPSLSAVWALTRTLDEDWPCRETAKTSQDCCDKSHPRRSSSACSPSRQSSQISAQAGPRHSFARKLLVQSIQNRLCLPQTPLCSGRLFVFPRKPLHLLTVCFFRPARHFHRRNELSNTAVSGLSRRSPPNNIQLYPGISTTAYAL